MLPFTVLDAAAAVGMTTYMNIDAATAGRDRQHLVCRAHAAHGAEHRVQAHAAGHAFEALDCIAVEFRTHRFNTQSRRAIERLGAQLDGILRAHQRSPTAALRDTAVYSITAAEWPAAQAHLDWQLERPR
jgi:N-acetyltransferase